MSTGLRFHVLLLPNVNWPELKRRASWLETLGIDVIGIADHFVDWTNPAVPWFESWTALSALAEATSTIRLTTLVSQIPLRHPAVLARQALTLDHISGGRLEVGLGTGLAIDPAYAMIGVPNWEAGERVSRFEEYVQIVERLLRQEVSSFEGRHYAIDGAVMNPRPVQKPGPPLLIAALAPRMLGIAARHADIWNMLSFQPAFADQLAEARGRIERVESECARIGRDPGTLRRSYTMFDAMGRHRGGRIRYLESAADFAAEATQIIDLGISDIGLYYPLDPAQAPVFEEIARRVLPELRNSA